MKKLFVAFILILFSLTSCSNKNESGSVQVFAFNTIIEVTINDHYSQELADEIQNELSRLEKTYSRYIEGSSVDALNSNGQVQGDQEFIDILQEAIYYSEITQGRFDVSLGPVIDLWGIGTEDEQVPSEIDIKKALDLTGYERIGINGQEIVLDKGMTLDFGGILKGYATDRIRGIFNAHDVESGIIYLGGNVFVYGRKPDGNLWNVGIRNPDGERNDSLGMLSVGHKSVVTSGPYERFFEEDGVVYHHIFDHLTGYPVRNEIVSVTIVSKNSIDGDALTTGIFALGIEEGLALVEALEDIECIIVTNDKKVYLSEGIESDFMLKDTSFSLVKE